MKIRGNVVDTLIPLDADFREIQFGLPNTEQLPCIEQTVLQAANNVYHNAYDVREALIRSLVYGSVAGGTGNAEQNKSSIDKLYDAWLLPRVRDRIPLTEEQKSIARQLSGRISSTSAGWSHGVTRKGYICVLHKVMRPGDVIAVLEGGRAPYALRPVGDGKYRTLGEMYVEGLMYGEVWAYGELLEDIVLV